MKTMSEVRRKRTSNKAIHQQQAVLILSLLLILFYPVRSAIPTITEIPKTEVISTPTIETEREQETNHDVAEIPLIPPDIFPVRGVDDILFPSEPFRPPGIDDTLKSEQHVPDPKPCGRWQHTTVPIGAELYTYGGVSNGGAGSLNDVWMYNGASGDWTKLEKNELCTLPVRVNPRMSSSNNGARPPLFPAPPKLRLAPGLSTERMLRLRHEQERLVVKKARIMPIDRMTPVPTQEPVMPAQEKYEAGEGGSSSATTPALTGGLGGFSGLRRRRRLQSYQELGVLPSAEHNDLQTNPRTLNDLWVFDISKRRWFQPFPTDRQPPPRWLHGAVSIDRSLIIFGGVTNNLMLLNDIWAYRPLSNSWEVLGEGTEAMDRPTPREGMSMVTTDKEINLLIFGGIGYGYVPYNDVWRFTMKTETWELLEVVEDDDTDKNENKNENVYKEPTVPPPRWMHTSSTVEAKAGTEMYVFGGCSSSFAPIDDLWKFSVKTKKWKNMLGNRRVDRPEGRWLHSASVLPIDEENYIFAVVIFGGTVNNQPMDDLWQYNTESNEWEEMHPFTDHPYARAGHTLVSVVKGKVAKETEEASGGAEKKRRRRLLQLSDLKLPESSDLFAMEGPQDLVKVDHHSTIDRDAIAKRRPTIVADEFMFLFGGMSERGLGASSTKGGLGPDPEYPRDF